MSDVLTRFHQVLVEEIRARRPEYLDGPFTVAEIYQNLIPYGTHRDRIGVEMNGDYEDALLRILSGEGGYLLLESEHALRALREEIAAPNPNTGLYREFAAVDVRLNPAGLGGRASGGRVPSVVADSGVSGTAESAPETVSVGDLAPDGVSHDAPGPMEPVGEMSDLPAAPEDGAAEGVSETCPWCRAELPRRAALNFCPFCGTDIHVVPCPGCGEELEPEWRFCISCGTEVGA